MCAVRYVRFLCEFGRDKFSNFSLLPFFPSCLFEGGREKGPHGITLQLRMEGPAALFHHHPSFRLLPRCTSPASLLQAHSQLITTGLILHTYPLSHLLLLLSSLSKPLYAISVLRQSPRPSTFLFNVLISFSDTFPLLSWCLYFELASSLPLHPNSHSYTSLLWICGSPNVGLPLHAHILKFVGHSPNPFVQADLLSFYCRCGKIEIACRLFNKIPQPDLPTWNSMISAYTASQDVEEEALSLFRWMQISLTRPNEITVVALVSACAALGTLSHGMWLHAYVIRELRLNRIVATTLMTMYGRSGKLAMAEQVFSTIKAKDTATCNAMIQVFAIHGKVEQALKHGLWRRRGVCCGGNDSVRACGACGGRAAMLCCLGETFHGALVLPC